MLTRCAGSSKSKGPVGGRPRSLADARCSAQARRGRVRLAALLVLAALLELLHSASGTQCVKQAVDRCTFHTVSACCSSRLFYKQCSPAQVTLSRFIGNAVTMELFCVRRACAAHVTHLLLLNSRGGTRHLCRYRLNGRELSFAAYAAKLASRSADTLTTGPHTAAS
jgi:hypothetical protein